MVAAEHRERDEDLARVGDGAARAEVAQARGDRHERARGRSPRGHSSASVSSSDSALPGPARASGATQRVRGRLGHRRRAYYALPRCRSWRSPAGSARGSSSAGWTARSPASPHGRRQHRRRHRDPRAACVPRSRLRHLLARRCLRSRTRLGSARRDLPRDGGAAGVDPRSTPGSAWATSTWRRTCSGRSCSHEGRSLSEATAELCATLFGLTTRGAPDDRRRGDHADRCGRSPPASRSTSTSRSTGCSGTRRTGQGVRFEGVERAAPAPGVLDAIAEADVVLLCPSNPVVSIGPILAVPGVRDAVAARRGPVVGVSPIVGGAPARGDGRQADARRRARGLGARRGARVPRPAHGVGDRRTRRPTRRPAIADELGIRVAVTDTVMRDDDVAAAVARTAVELAS